MPRINEHYLNLKASYLFAEIKRRTQAFREAHPGTRVISLGIGDVTQPLPPIVARTLEEAAREMTRSETFKGYGPYVGYEFLRAEIAAHDFGGRGVSLTPHRDLRERRWQERQRQHPGDLRRRRRGGPDGPGVPREAHVVGMPGSGFGPSGEGYFRLTAFGARAETEEAVERIRTRLRRT